MTQASSMSAPGQLYVVETRAVTKDRLTKVRAMFLVTATSLEAVHQKLPYVLDLSVYAEFSVKGIRRVKPNFHVVYSHSVPLDEDEAFVEPDGQVLHFTRTNQPTNRKQYAVGIAGSVTADNEDHALRKLGTYLSSKGTASELHTPLHGGVVHVEEIGEGSLTTMARDVSQWKRGHEVRTVSVG